jgi:hypothetical protein
MRRFFFRMLIPGLIMIPSTVLSQQPQTFDSRVLNAGSRSASLGDAATAEAYDVTDMFWNPSSLSFLAHNSVVVGSMVQTGLEFSHFNAALPFHFGADHSIGIGISETYEGNNRWTQPIFSDEDVDVAYSARLWPTFSTGILVDAQHAQTNSSSAWIESSTAGVFYFPTPGVCYGATIGGIGTGFLTSSSRSSDALQYIYFPEPMLAVGTSFQFPDVSAFPTTFITFASERLFRQKRLVNKGGIEISPIKELSFRLGVTSGTGRALARWGLGYRGNLFRLDYSFTELAQSYKFHQATLSVMIGTL